MRMEEIQKNPTESVTITKEEETMGCNWSGTCKANENNGT